MHLLRRLCYLPISLLLLSFVCFGLRSISPGDPIEQALPVADSRQADQSPEDYDRRYRRAAARLGYDLPPFYFSVYNVALPDTLSRIVRSNERRMVRALTLDAGNWDQVAAYYHQLKASVYRAAQQKTPTPELVTARRLLNQDDPERIATLINQLRSQGQLPNVVAAFEAIYQQRTRANLLLPTIRWNGRANQYHRWLSGLFEGDFGTSIIDRQPVMTKIVAALPGTLLLNGLAILIIFLVSIPLGLYLASHAGSRRDTVINFLLFAIFSIPSFWVATMLANFLTTPAFGLDLFPSMGFGNPPEGADWWTALSTRAAHLFLPVMCLAYPSWAYVTQHLRGSAIAELNAAYVKTARMKGLSQWQILWRHVLRNASFPLITIIGGLVPALLGGSILIERIFSLPGMGQLLYQAAVSGDWPTITALILINGVLTAVGLLIADLAYALLDPRVRFSKSAGNPVLQS